MFVEDEKDYIMRMIGQMVRAFVSLILGKEFRMEELPDENKHKVSVKPLEEYLAMVNAGQINEAFGFVNEGKSDKPLQGGAEWFQMRLSF